MNIDYETYENPVIVEGEIEKLQLLKQHALNDDLQKINEMTVLQKSKRKSGIYISLESDIKAYFNLSQSLTISWMIKDKFSMLSQSEILELLINRIDAVKLGPIRLPENLFESKTFRIEYGQRLIDVVEIRRKHWEYIVYKSINDSNEYYVSMVFSHNAADWSRMLKLTEDEVKIVQTNNHQEINQMIIHKRNNN